MTPEEKRTEIAKLLAFIYYEWGEKVTDRMVSYWARALAGMERKFAWRVAEELVRSKSYGKPRLQDFWTVALRLSRRKVLQSTYNPHSPATARVELLDMPGCPVISEGDEQAFLPPPPPGEERRQITGPEKTALKLIARHT